MTTPAKEKPEWEECPTCGGLFKNLTNTKLGQGLKELIETFPDPTPANEDKEVVGADCMCVLGSKKHSPDCWYAYTPANEWREEFDKEFTFVLGRYHDYPNGVKVKKSRDDVKDFIQNLLDQHSARLVERIEKESQNCKYGHEFSPTCERCLARAEMRDDILNKDNK